MSSNKTPSLLGTVLSLLGIDINSKGKPFAYFPFTLFSAMCIALAMSSLHSLWLGKNLSESTFCKSSGNLLGYCEEGAVSSNLQTIFYIFTFTVLTISGITFAGVLFHSRENNKSLTFSDDGTLAFRHGQNGFVDSTIHLSNSVQLFDLKQPAVLTNA